MAKEIQNLEWSGVTAGHHRSPSPSTRHSTSRCAAITGFHKAARSWVKHRNSRLGGVLEGSWWMEESGDWAWNRTRSLQDRPGADTPNDPYSEAKQARQPRAYWNSPAMRTLFVPACDMVDSWSLLTSFDVLYVRLVGRNARFSLDTI